MLSPQASPVLVPALPEKLLTDCLQKSEQQTFIQNEMNETHTHIKDGLNLVIGLVLVLSNFVKTTSDWLVRG